MYLFVSLKPIINMKIYEKILVNIFGFYLSYIIKRQWAYICVAIPSEKKRIHTNAFGKKKMF